MLITELFAVGCAIAGCYQLCNNRSASWAPYLLLLAGLFAMVMIPLVDIARKILG